MHTGRMLTLVGLAVAVLTAAGIAMAGSDRSATTVATKATTQFHDVAAATAAGYGEFKDAAGIACIESSAGGMGIHYVNLGLVVKADGTPDTVLDPARPEALVYEPRDNGKLKLVALEYIVFAEAWDAAHADPPSMFGREFDFTPAGNRYGIPAFYALHAWIWKPNSAGLLEPYNPRIDC
jgi:hypothetical protein